MTAIAERNVIESNINECFKIGRNCNYSRLSQALKIIGEHEYSVAEIAVRTGVGNRHMHYIVTTLCHFGFVGRSRGVSNEDVYFLTDLGMKFYTADNESRQGVFSAAVTASTAMYILLMEGEEACSVYLQKRYAVSVATAAGMIDTLYKLSFLVNKDAMKKF